MVTKIDQHPEAVVTVEQSGNSVVWDSVRNVDQIGEKYGSLLADARIGTIGAFLTKSPSEIADILAISQSFAVTLQENAEEYISQETTE